MSSDVGYIGSSPIIRIPKFKYAVQMIGTYVGRLAALIAFVPIVPALSADALGFHETLHPVFAASLPEILEVQSDVPAAAHATAFQPGLLDQANQPAVGSGARNFWILQP